DVECGSVPVRGAGDPRVITIASNFRSRDPSSERRRVIVAARAHHAVEMQPDSGIPLGEIFDVHPSVPQALFERGTEREIKETVGLPVWDPVQVATSYTINVLNSGATIRRFSLMTHAVVRFFLAEQGGDGITR